MRLIDADAITEFHYSEIAYVAPNDIKGMARVFKSQINRMPTIDAQPVARGEWIQKKTALGKTYSVCSRCETDFKFQTDKGTLARLDMEGLNFCPNCSAKMSKEES